jgi:4'-phosphopantetheinyl transferase
MTSATPTSRREPAIRRLADIPPHLGQVWAVRPDLLEAATSSALREACDAGELARAERLPLATQRQQFLLTRGALRTLIGVRIGVRPTDVQISRDLDGKPRLAAGHGDLRFNVSHSRGLALIALCHGREVGVDVEVCDPELDIDAVLRRFFPRTEAARLSALPLARRRAAFFRSWTRKEAWLKATGGGLRHPIGSVPTPPGDEPAPRCQPASGWHIADLDVAPGYKAALVAPGRPRWTAQARQSTRGASYGRA